MSTKKKFESIDQSQLSESQKAILSKIKTATKDFTITDEKALEKVDGALDNIIEKLKKTNPQAIKSEKKEVVKPKKEVSKKPTESRTKEPKKGTGSKRTIFSIAKEIRKADESWEDAKKRAKKVMESEKEDTTKKMKSETDKLLTFIKRRKELDGISGTTLKKDAKLEALPKGKRISKKGWKNQHGESKGGKVYYENRDNRSDRLAPNYPSKVYLEDGGMYECGGSLTLTPETPLARGLGMDYTGLVGETGAMSSGEMFEDGGGVARIYEVGIDEGDIKGTRTIADFDTEKEAKDFLYEYKLKHPRAKLFIDSSKSDFFYSQYGTGSKYDTKKSMATGGSLVDGYLTDPNFGDFQAGIYAEGGSVGKSLSKFRVGESFRYKDNGTIVYRVTKVYNDGACEARDEEGDNYTFEADELSQLEEAKYELGGSTGLPEGTQQHFVNYYLGEGTAQGIYAEGGSLENHGLKEGDQVLKTISGGVQKVRTKDGEIVFVDLANGYRDYQPPLPFAKGGRLKSALARDRKYFNESESWERQYSKNKPSRKGYKFDDGGFMTDPNFGDFQTVVYAKRGALLSAKERYILELKGLTGLTKEGVEKYISDNGLTEDEVLNIVIGLGRKQIQRMDVVTAMTGKKNNAESKRLIRFAKSDKALKLADGGTIDAFQIRTIKGDNNMPTEVLTSEQEVRFKKGGETLSDKTNGYVSIDSIEKVVTKDGKVFKNTYTDTAVISGVHFSNRPLREKEGKDKNQMELFKKGGLPKTAIYIPRYKVDYIETEDGDKIEGNHIYGGVWIDMKKQFRLVEEAKKEGRFEDGGKTTFKQKATAIAKNFEGKKVEPKYQKEYGKTYDKAEAKEVGNKIAGSQKAKYDSKMTKGGSVKKSGSAMVYAKKIRKDGESWRDALIRANKEMKKQ